MHSTSSKPRLARRLTARLGLGAAVGLAAVIIAASSASAHIKIDGDGTATVGTTSAITFRVPTESDTATTVGVTVTFPEDTPFSSVQPLYKPGWNVKVTTADLPKAVTDSTGKQITNYVKSVTWTATAGGIPSELYDTFTVRAGAVPNAKSIALPALQTYSDGSTVNWNEASTGSTEPEHPAPVLQLLPAASASPAPADQPSATASSDTASDMKGMDMSDSSTPSWPGITGLIAGVIGLILGGIALARTARKRPEQQ